MNELEIITEDNETIILELSKDRDHVCVCVNENLYPASAWITLSQAKQIVNFLNQVL